MEFSPTAIALVVIGVLSVIIGIRGSNGAVFQTLTGHTTTNTAGSVAGGSLNMPSTGSTALTSNNPTNPFLPVHGAS